MPSEKDPALTCTRCQGFVMTDPYDTRCLNCGNRPLDVLRPPEAAPQGRRKMKAPGTCRTCLNEAEPDKQQCRPCLDRANARVQARNRAVLEVSR